jgi:ComF family protein
MAYARLLGALLARWVEAAAPPLPQLVIPVPLHRQRLRERGFNQALEIARAPARRLGLELGHRYAWRQRATSPQSGLDAAERRRNLRGAFQVRLPPGVTHLAVVDDVVTTGYTVSELTRTLKQAGAHRVDVWAVARTP